MDKKYNILMMLSFIYGGYLLSLYLVNIYSILWRHEFMTTSLLAASRFSRNQGHASNLSPFAMIISPSMVVTLIGGLICMANGFVIRALTHEKEIKKVKSDMKSLFLIPEEKHLISELEKSGGELTQKELTDITGYSRVKVHRIIQKLESKKLIRKVPYGQTNKILITSE